MTSVFLSCGRFGAQTAGMAAPLGCTALQRPAGCIDAPLPPLACQALVQKPCLLISSQSFGCCHANAQPLIYMAASSTTAVLASSAVSAVAGGLDMQSGYCPGRPNPFPAAVQANSAAIATACVRA